MAKQPGDAGKPATGYDTFTAEATYNPEPSSLSYKDVVNEFITELRSHRYMMIPDGGPFAGFGIYQPKPSELPNAPEGFTVLRPVDPSSKVEVRRMEADVQRTTLALMGNCDDDDEASKTLSKQLNGIWKTISDRPSDPKSQLYQMSKVLGRYKEEPRVTLSGKSGHVAHIPLRSWFPAQLQDYDASGLLTLFPEAEKKMLMLVIARAVIGRSGNDVAEGTVDHNFRSMALIVGDPGLGKSTFLYYLTDALEHLGFVCKAGPTNLNQFAWAAAEHSSLMHWDDMTEDFQGRLLANNNIKSIVSGGPIMVEPKGEAAYEIKSNPALVALTNVANYMHLIGLDPGVLSRVNHLLTYSKEELDERGLMPLREHWVAESKRLGVPIRLLAMLLIRECIDLFLDVTGIAIADGQMTRCEERDRLVGFTMDLRDRFRFHTKLSHADEITDKVARYLALDIARCREKDQARYIELALKGEFRPEFLRCWLQAILADDRQPDDIYPDHLADVADFVLPKLAAIDGVKKTRSAAEYFQWLMSQLLSKEGFGYPKHLGYYQSRWSRTVNSIPTWVGQYNEKDMSTVGKKATGVVDYL